MKTNSMVERDMSTCDYTQGNLPECAPLAVGMVPVQQAQPPVYKDNEALSRGTLFPGLDLPFKNYSNKTNPYAGTPLGEVMALHFVRKELNLYLDTHPKDAEAFEMLKSVIAMEKECRAKYVKKYGPISVTDLANAESYTWTHDPWPWEFCERGAQ